MFASLPGLDENVSTMARGAARAVATFLGVALWLLPVTVSSPDHVHLDRRAYLATHFGLAQSRARAFAKWLRDAHLDFGRRGHPPVPYSTADDDDPTIEGAAPTPLADGITRSTLEPAPDPVLWVHDIRSSRPGSSRILDPVTPRPPPSL